MCSMIRNHQMYFVARLSFEMLSAVFLEAPFDLEWRTAFATSVSQVSRYWRQVALNTPFIWSGIYVGWRTGREYLKFLQIVIQRSKSHPLDIKVNAWDDDDFSTAVGCSYPLDPIRAQIEVVILEISRWRSFIFDGEYPSDAPAVLKPLSHLCAPILESFELSSRCIATTFYALNDLNVFQGGAPMLSRISVFGMNVTSCLPPLSSTTSLHLTAGKDWLTGQEFLGLLRSSPVLESLHLDGYLMAHEDLYPLALQGENVELVSLRSFSFSADATPKYFLESLLNILHCPKLKKMTICSWGFLNLDEVGPTLGATLALAIPAYPELHFMELRGIECAQFVTNFDFTQLPRLEIISLIRCTFPTSLLRLLLPSQGRVNDKGCIWPTLRHIQLSCLEAEDFGCLCEIISYRQTTGRPIESVEIDPDSLDKFPEKVSWMEQRVKVQRGEDFLSNDFLLDLALV